MKYTDAQIRQMPMNQRLEIARCETVGACWILIGSGLCAAIGLVIIAMLSR